MNIYVHFEIQKRRQFFGPQKLIGIVCVRTSSVGGVSKLGSVGGDSGGDGGRF